MNLITGATGHIGNVLARELRARGEQVRALVLRGENTRPLDGVDVELIEGDVLDVKSLERAMTGVHTVYHLAGLISILPGRHRLMWRVNVEGTHNVLAAARSAGVKRLVYTSSIHAIARAPHGVVIDESLPFDPANPYGEYDRSKAEASLAVLEAARRGMDAVIACPTGVVGPYDFRRSEMGQLILDCVEHRPPLYVDGAYDFVDVRDVAGGLIRAAQLGKPGETYILSGEQITVRRLLELVITSTGRKLRLFWVPMSLARFVARIAPLYYRLARVKPRFTPYSLEVLESNSVISHAKARRELGYAPRSLRESLGDMVHWFTENRGKLLKAEV